MVCDTTPFQDAFMVNVTVAPKWYATLHHPTMHPHQIWDS